MRCNAGAQEIKKCLLVDLFLLRGGLVVVFGPQTPIKNEGGTNFCQMSYTPEQRIKNTIDDVE